MMDDRQEVGPGPAKKEERSEETYVVDPRFVRGLPSPIGADGLAAGSGGHLAELRARCRLMIEQDYEGDGHTCVEIE